MKMNRTWIHIVVGLQLFSSVWAFAAPLEGERLVPDLSGCDAKLERRSAASWECRLSYSFRVYSGMQLLEKGEAHFRTSGCEIELQAEGVGYQLIISQIGTPKQPLLSQEGASRCLRELTKEWKSRPFSVLLVFGKG